MAYDPVLAARVRDYLHAVQKITVEEKEMFGGLVFLVNGKMCVNVSEDNLMCRFDPARTEELAQRAGYLPLLMKNREMKGYCDVEPHGFSTNQDVKFWMEVCLDFNSKARMSKKRRKNP